MHTTIKCEVRARMERFSNDSSIVISYSKLGMGWLRFVGSIKLQVSVAKETYKRKYILQKRPLILSILLTVAIP